MNDERSERTGFLFSKFIGLFRRDGVAGLNYRDRSSDVFASARRSSRPNSIERNAVSICRLGRMLDKGRREAEKAASEMDSDSVIA